MHTVIHRSVSESHSKKPYNFGSSHSLFEINMLTEDQPIEVHWEIMHREPRTVSQGWFIVAVVWLGVP